ncbi:hypothetical protein HUB97_07135 [Halorubraceae archaeon YAN]|nr:hypothetical protein [Halorubraceae archaeon YAN]
MILDRSSSVRKRDHPYTLIRGHQVSPERPRTTGPCGIFSAATDDECHAIADFDYADSEASSDRIVIQNGMIELPNKSML